MLAPRIDGLESRLQDPMATSESGQFRRFGDVSDWSAYPSIAIDLLQCDEPTKCANSGSDRSLFRQPRLTIAINKVLTCRLVIKRLRFEPAPDREVLIARHEHCRFALRLVQPP